MTPAARRRDDDDDEPQGRDAPEQQAVPASTVTYAQAIAAGFWGARTDPYDDAIYASHGGGIPPDSLTSVAPATQVHTITGPWSVVATGQFYIPSPNDWTMTLQTGDHKDQPSVSIVVTSATSITANFVDGPNRPAAAGAGYAELKCGSTIVAQVPFTWT